MELYSVILGEKIDENDCERLDNGYEMWGGLVAKKLRQQSSKTVQPEAVTL